MLLTLPEWASKGILFSAICSALRFHTTKTQSGLPASDIIFDKPSLKLDMGAMVDAALGVSGFGYASRQMPLR
jgi:hypothetical protein